MSKKSKKRMSLTGILTLINIVIVIGIVMLIMFGPAGARANAKSTLDFVVYCITLFQVNAGGAFTISTVAIILTLSMYMAVVLVLVLFILYLAKKAWKSLSAVFSLLLSSALVAYSAAFFALNLRGVMGSVQKASLFFIMGVAILVLISFVLSLITCLSGTLGSFSDKIGGGVVREVVKEENNEELEKKVAELEERIKELENRPVAVAAAAVVTEEEPKEPVKFTVQMIKDYVESMKGEEHPVATENRDANGGNGPVSNNVDVCNMALTYGKDEVSSLLIRLEAEKANEYKKSHSVEASNFAGSGDYYKLLVNDGSYTEEEQLWEIIEASYAYVLSKYFKVEDGKYVALEEEPVEEEPKEEPVVVAPVEEEPEEEKVIIERVPFADKVRRSDRELKDKYDELKAYLLSYGLKSRISIDGDTYRLHTVKYVHITIAGKKMKVYFALNPNDYLTSTTPVKEAKAKKYAEVKAYLDVKSDLSVKRAKALIDTVMQNAGIEKKETEAAE